MATMGLLLAPLEAAAAADAPQPPPENVSAVGDLLERLLPGARWL